MPHPWESCYKTEEGVKSRIQVTGVGKAAYEKVEAVNIDDFK